MTLELERQRFTADEYHKMAEVGILRSDDRVELIDGEIIRMSPIGSRHADCVNRLMGLVYDQLHGTATVSIQNPVRLSVDYEPEPDLAALRPRNETYAERHPAPEDVLLVIEVSDSSLQYDLTMKLPAYGRSGVLEAWIVDLDGERIERHTDPFAGGYRLRALAQSGERLTSTVLPQVVIDVDAVLGRQRGRDDVTEP